MPRGNPKLPILVRFDRALVEAVKAYDVQFTEAVEEGLRLWLARETRRQARDAAQRPPAKRRTA